MSIWQNGRDVTAEVMAEAARRGARERVNKPWAKALEHLVIAEGMLNDIPGPWMNDCISDCLSDCLSHGHFYR